MIESFSHSVIGLLAANGLPVAVAPLGPSLKAFPSPLHHPSPGCAAFLTVTTSDYLPRL
jgi:hypothetical protein